MCSAWQIPGVASPASVFPFYLVRELDVLQTTIYVVNRIHVSGLSPWFKCRHIPEAVLRMNFGTYLGSPGNEECVLCPSVLVLQM